MKKTGILSLVVFVMSLAACDTSRSVVSAPSAPPAVDRPVKQMATPDTDGSNPNVPPPTIFEKKTKPPRGGEPLEIGPMTPVIMGKTDTMR